jgi:hypothetical protein
LQSPELRNYLAASRKSRVVLTDYAAMEAFKGDALQNILTATAVLREFPKQVIVLKSTGVLATLKGRRCGYSRRMIDRKQTRGFPDWCKHLARAEAGDKDLQRQIVENGQEADAHLKRMRDDQSDYAENLDAMAKNFSDAELKILRKREPIPADMFGKIQDHVFEMHPWWASTGSTSPKCFRRNWLKSGTCVTHEARSHDSAMGESHHQFVLERKSALAHMPNSVPRLHLVQAAAPG